MGGSDPNMDISIFFLLLLLNPSLNSGKLQPLFIGLHFCSSLLYFVINHMKSVRTFLEFSSGMGDVAAYVRIFKHGIQD